MQGKAQLRPAQPCTTRLACCNPKSQLPINQLSTIPTLQHCLDRPVEIDTEPSVPFFRKPDYQFSQSPMSTFAHSSIALAVRFVCRRILNRHPAVVNRNHDRFHQRRRRPVAASVAVGAAAIDVEPVDCRSADSARSGMRRHRRFSRRLWNRNFRLTFCGNFCFRNFRNQTHFSSAPHVSHVSTPQLHPKHFYSYTLFYLSS